MTQKTFTLAAIAKGLNMDPKAARRKARADFAREKSSLKSTVKNPSSKNVRWEWIDNEANREMVTAFLTGK